MRSRRRPAGKAAAAAAVLLLLGDARASYSPSEWALIEAKTASASATIEFTKGIDAVHQTYVVEFHGVAPATDAQPLRLRVSTDGGSTWEDLGTDYDSGGHVNCDNASFGSYESDSGGQTSILITPLFWNQSNAANSHANGTVTIYDPADSGKRTRLNVETVFRDDAGNDCWSQGGAAYFANTAVNALQFFYASGDIAAGKFRLYGVR